jgi:hypothetical protein
MIEDVDVSEFIGLSPGDREFFIWVIHALPKKNLKL